MSDEQIDELLNQLDQQAEDYSFYEFGLPIQYEGQLVRFRAIVRNWLPAAAVCPKRVRLNDGSGKQYVPCDVLSMTIAQNGTVLSYDVRMSGGYETQVPANLYEPVTEEA